MHLSENFTLEELTSTDTGLPNNPGHGEAEKLMYLANYVLQPVRDRWGPVRVTSGFRSALVNERVGGSPASQHLAGEAADMVPVEAEMRDVFHWIVTRGPVAFGQCILEEKGGAGWIHVSLVRPWKDNYEPLVYDGSSFERYGGRYESLL